MIKSQINQDRWRQFKKNRRAYFSFWLFLSLLLLSFCAELWINNKPLMMRYEGRLHFPVLIQYSDQDFGGFLDSEANYHDPEVQTEIKSKGWMLWPLVPYNFKENLGSSIEKAPQRPDKEHWLGVDIAGRSVLARVVYGFRLSVIFGLLLSLCSLGLGVIVGTVQAFYGGWLDLFGQRFLEVWNSLPSFFVLVIIASFFQVSVVMLFFVMLLLSWPGIVPVVRAEVLKTRQAPFVQAAQALGVPLPVVMFRHVLPNALVATLTFAPLIAAGSIFSLATLDFLGLGLPHSTPSLGELLRQGWSEISTNAWLAVIGISVISLIMMLFIFIGEGVRDAFDSRKEVRSCF